MVSNREARAMGYVDRIHYKHYPYMGGEEYKRKVKGIGKVKGYGNVISPDGKRISISFKNEAEAIKLLGEFHNKGFELEHGFKFKVSGKISSELMNLLDSFGANLPPREDKIQHNCPYCHVEIILPNESGDYRCPSCGKEFHTDIEDSFEFKSGGKVPIIMCPFCQAELEVPPEYGIYNCCECRKDFEYVPKEELES